ncbi:ABC transporter ATP-binding protein [Niveibacterium sp. 24ML]|uniref:ABC transporter ATP-binding protein n=1 Tax=Niveibacterium sp. 24ML TaxID=2985512 RepID=UPI0022702AFF|nr:ABC transporter ATP-binding protein [Niveibacterium sp. 24ML]MCX9158463.1 ABC transporter ATP-binding protein [Niveibacterium sp. 24ML]
MSLAVSGLGKALGGRALFADLSLEMAAGEFVAVMGESGTGKSTLLNLIAGLEMPDAGRVSLGEQSLAGLDDAALTRWRRQALGFVFQAFHILPHLDVRDNVALPLRLNGRTNAEARAAAQAMLDQVGLGARGASAPGELSGGELQRVAIARALVHRPALVLADEPTGNLDPDNAARVLALLAEQVRVHGAMCLMVTHSAQAAAIADRVLLLAGGRLQRA